MPHEQNQVPRIGGVADSMLFAKSLPPTKAFRAR
jgi:hypothetical protein